MPTPRCAPTPSTSNEAQNRKTAPACAFEPIAPSRSRDRAREARSETHARRARRTRPAFSYPHLSVALGPAPPPRLRATRRTEKPRLLRFRTDGALARKSPIARSRGARRGARRARDARDGRVSRARARACPSRSAPPPAAAAAAAGPRRDGCAPREKTAETPFRVAGRASGGSREPPGGRAADICDLSGSGAQSQELAPRFFFHSW